MRMMSSPDGSASAAALAELERAAHGAKGPAIAREYLDLLTASPELMHREGGPVHLTASAIVIDAPGEHVALVWHRKGRFWVQPGGHVEEGETSFEQAARREVAEEIGLQGLEIVGDGPAVLNQHDLDAAFGRCAAHWDVQFLLRAPAAAAELPLTVSAESEEVRWVHWPLFGTDAERAAAHLPEGTVPDLEANLEELARHLARQAA